MLFHVALAKAHTSAKPSKTKFMLLTCLLSFLATERTRVLEKKVSQTQGSILGPLIFLIYINDLPNCLNTASLENLNHLQTSRKFVKSL